MKISEYRCEASVGMIKGFKPTIKLCGKLARLYGIAALCDDHKEIAFQLRKENKE